MYLFPEDVPGFDELWIIGETSFTHTATKYLRPLINSGRKLEAPPYFTSRYDLKWDIDYDSKACWSQIRNSFARMLNQHWKLPNYIIIIFSNKCIQETLHYAQQLYLPMNALGDFINRAIFQRTTELPARALRPSDPQVILVRTVSKSDKFQELNNFKNKRRTFNKAVQKLSERNGFKSINIDQILPSKDIFNSSGDLSAEGYNIFWNDINIFIKQNDMKWLKAFEDQMGSIPVREPRISQVTKTETDRHRGDDRKARVEHLDINKGRSSSQRHRHRADQPRHRNHTSSEEDTRNRRDRYSSRDRMHNCDKDNRSFKSNIYW